MSQRNRSTENAESQHISWVNEFLWTCAGVNKAVLRQCPSDYAKYAGIGGTILFTALMATLSGGYAMSYVFKDAWISIGFGIFWGLLIFNLDRFIVNTMYSDGKHTISWGEIRSGLPRIIMAIFLGIVISTPLEMKIFSDQITARVAIDNGKREKDARESYQYLYDELDKYEEELHKISEDKQKLETNLQNAQEEYDKEVIGNNGHRGDGPIAKALYKHVEECKASIARFDASKTSDIERLNNDIARVKNTIRIQEEQNKKDASNNGFAVRYQAFEEVTSWSNPETRPLAIVSLMITLLFVIIETAPTFFKMMMEDGPYDHLLNAEKHRVKVMSDKRISDVNDEINTAVRISTMKNEKRLEAETIANQDILEKIARAQAELLETAIARWKEIELEKIRQNPSDYVVSLVPPRHEIEVVTDNDDNLTEISAMTSQRAENQHSENLNAVSEDNNYEPDSESQTETRGDESIDENTTENTNPERSER